uniref:Uncharacterized protein n=1 Tax=Lates calcarifer TaxID=8187 RepID=A0A4W6F0M5_LATCA
MRMLNSINDLKKINFGHSVPKHSLLLLHWFANEVDIDNNNVIWLTVDLNDGDYGSHHYGNFEGLLDQLPHEYVRYQYYTIGNLHQDTSVPLPSYVTHPRSEYAGKNEDRIIIRIREPNKEERESQRIDRVFITQHSGYRTYDPEHTYEITTNLLRQIREFSVSVGEDQSSITYLRDRYGSSYDTSVNLDNGKCVLLFCCMHFFFYFHVQLIVYNFSLFCKCGSLNIDIQG